MVNNRLNDRQVDMNQAHFRALSYLPTLEKPQPSKFQSRSPDRGCCLEDKFGSLIEECWNQDRYSRLVILSGGERCCVLHCAAMNFLTGEPIVAR